MAFQSSHQGASRGGAAKRRDDKPEPGTPPEWRSVHSSQEYPSRFVIGGSHRQRDFAFVDVDFIWEATPAGKKETTRISSRLALFVLRLERERWLIDDIVTYDDKSDFAQSLRSFLAENNPK